MRDINRLDKIYNKILTYHKEFPDIRFMQFMINFFTWYKFKYGNDGYYIEDNIFILRLEEFMKDTFNRR